MKKEREQKKRLCGRRTGRKGREAGGGKRRPFRSFCLYRQNSTEGTVLRYPTAGSDKKTRQRGVRVRSDAPEGAKGCEKQEKERSAEKWKKGICAGPRDFFKIPGRNKAAVTPFRTGAAADGPTDRTPALTEKKAARGSSKTRGRYGSRKRTDRMSGGAGPAGMIAKENEKMRIAVTFENGNVFQHFGHTEEFKVYEAENGKVVSSAVVGSDGKGHGALAGLLNDRGIDVLICGGIGGGAVSALSERGIEVCAGASGNADEAVEAYLRGELKSTGANCDHHGEGHDCGEHGSSDREGQDCGGCRPASAPEGKNVGRTCRVHYRGTFNDGTQFDSSYDRGEPLEFVCGAGQMIKGFDAAVAGMERGEAVDIHLMPSEAYGDADPGAVFTLPLAQLPGAEVLSVGQRVYLQDSSGRPFAAKVTARDGRTITFDANHEMAGKELNFHIELVEVE